VSLVRIDAAARTSRCDRRRPAGRAAHALLALAAGYVGVTACDYTDYPIQATFCDDWCRVMRRTGCEQEPENCIRDCQGSLPSQRCQPLQSSLLDCYQNTPADRFECVGQGFQSTVRPRPEICTEQRQSLIRCEVPRVMECVEACAELDASDPSRSPDAGASPGASAGMCPQPPFPCERLCWELDARFGRGEATNLDMTIDRNDDTDLASLGAPLIRCAQARAAECRSGASPAPPEGVSWTALFLECAGLPVDFDAFDD
jgi:hypothetical protein